MQATYSIRRATEKDIPGLQHLLEQVNLVHHKGRPDLFNRTTKYGDDDLKVLLRDEHFPVLVAMGTIDDAEIPLGHAFCQIIEHKGERLLADIRTLYIDDICVDERVRRMGVGKGLYEACLDLARSLHCKNVTLNVWACNPGACAFYTKMGMAPLKYGMEVLL
ncbi:MAG: GNAT family N-acetyltransferase [Desulfovibrionaceae bacterium]|nr:GNAT family N-acetyltransferase [Desulfovibrionaceae bacterium]